MMENIIDPVRLNSARKADLWYSKRFNVNYPPWINGECIALFEAELRKRLVEEDEIAKLSREHMKYEIIRTRSQTVFSSDLELSSIINYSGNSWVNDLTNWQHGEYIQPLIDSVAKVEKFFDKITEKQKREPFLLNGEQFDTVFLDNYGSIDAFIESQHEYVLCQNMYLSAKAKAGIIEEDDFDKVRITLESLPPCIDYVTRKVFADLQDKK